MRLTFFTSITNSYFSKARILARSVKSVYPDSNFVVALLDHKVTDLCSIERAIDRVIVLGEHEVKNFRQWIYFHDVVEACTAQKGLIIERLLLEDESDAVIYLDPDIKVFSRFEELELALTDFSTVITPHLTDPSLTDSGVRDNELAASIHGTYNLGFLALRNSQQGRSVARWWKERLLKYCFDEKERGIFTDQKWFDLVPALFDDVFVLRHPGYNIATWNIENRKITQTDNKLKVNGLPVRFIHFSGFDSGAHRTMLDLYAPDQPEFRALSMEYAEELESLHIPRVDDQEWIYKKNDFGEVIARDWRRRYRDHKIIREVFKDPFAVSGEGLKRLYEVDPLSRAVMLGGDPIDILDAYGALQRVTTAAPVSTGEEIQETCRRLTELLPIGRPTIGMITHGLGGGVEIHINELQPVIMPFCNVVRMSAQRLAEDRWKLRLVLHGTSGNILDESVTSDVTTLVKIIEGIGFSRLHVHSILPEEAFWLSFFGATATPFDVTIHDYALLTDNWSMDDGDGGTLSLDLQDCALTSSEDKPLRQAAVKAMLTKAARVIFPSNSARTRFSRVVDVGNGIVAYHPEYPPPELVVRQPFKRPGSNHVMRIGILGDLVAHKGLKPISEFIRFGLRQGFSFEVHHFGAPHPLLDGQVVAHGSYSRGDLPRLIRTESVDLIWLPSQVHETYGYALSDAMMTQLPILASAVGAYPERLSNLERVSVLPPDAKANTVWNAAQGLILKGESVWLGAVRTPELSGVNSRDFYPDRYLKPVITGIDQ